MKKGFTLIELLGIILVLGLIVAFTVPSIMKTLKNSDDKEYENFLKTVSMASETYYQSNDKICNFQSENICYFDAKKLIESGLIDETLINPRTNKSIQSSDMIVVKKNEDGSLNYNFSSLEEYKQQGILVHYDAINNTRDGHDWTTDIWEDISGNSYDATLNNFDISNVWKNNALLFSGNNYGSTSSEYVAFDLSTQNSTEFTISLYTKQNSWADADSDRYQRIFSTYNSDETKRFNIYPSYQSNKYNGYIEFFGDGTSKYISSYGLSEAENYGLTVTCLGTTYKVFKNGQFVKSFDISSYTEISDITCNDILNSNMLLGNVYNFVRPYKGELYNFKIYNRVLTDEEIMQNYKVDNSRFNNID